MGESYDLRAMGMEPLHFRAAKLLPLYLAFLVLCASAEGVAETQEVVELSPHGAIKPEEVLPAGMLGASAKQGKYHNLAVVPVGTSVLKEMKATGAACKAACDKMSACQGFEHTSGNNECKLLAHKSGHVAAVNKKLRKDMVAAARRKVQNRVNEVRPSVRRTKAAARKQS